jgi:cytochrome c-type biogenesis protein
MNNNVTIVAALLGGIVSFLSPCVLPLVPAYLSYLVSDNTQNQRWILLRRAIGFVLGFSTVFILLGASASLIGKMLSANKATLRELSGVAMIFFGLHMVGILKLSFLYREKRLTYTPSSGSWLGNSFLLGVVFAAGWTPCIGPILASILLYASSSDTLAQGLKLLIAYSVGMAIPFLLCALLAQGLHSKIKTMNRYLPLMTKASGFIMIIMGYLAFNNKLSTLNSYFNFF